jgi:hypothetical protein
MDCAERLQLQISYRRPCDALFRLSDQTEDPQTDQRTLDWTKTLCLPGRIKPSKR